MGSSYLDWKEGLARLDGDEALYRRQLGQFMLEQREVAVQVAGALRKHEDETARHLVHELRGLAAQLGARPLASAAFELEMAIRAGAETAAVMGRFDRMLTDTLLVMASYRSF